MKADTDTAEFVYDGETVERFCPYCSQRAWSDEWWTPDQLDHMGRIMRNLAADIINRELLGPLSKLGKKNRRGMFSIEVKTTKAEKAAIWMAPERDDLDLFRLACCGKSLKTEHRLPRQLSCFWCGFPHETR